MRSLSRFIAVALALPLLWLADHAVADPAGSGEAGSGQGTFEAAPAATANESAAVQVESMLSSGEPRTASSGSADTTSSSAQAMEIMRDAQAGAAEHEASRPPQRTGAGPTRPHAGAGAGAGAHADEGGLRTAGKAALQWLKAALPWFGKAADEDSSAKTASGHPAGWLASPFEDRKAIRSIPAGAAAHADASVMPQSAPGAALGYDSNARGPALGATQNAISEVIEIARMVLEHPMTWLGVALFVIGALALSKFDRRPK